MAAEIEAEAQEDGEGYAGEEGEGTFGEEGELILGPIEKGLNPIVPLSLPQGGRGVGPKGVGSAPPGGGGGSPGIFSQFRLFRVTPPGY